jgi:23S rRNA pseudouridine1911/1915/1917 synthase
MPSRAISSCIASSVAETHHDLIAPPEAGRLDRWLADVLGLSRAKVVALVDGGCVLVDEQAVKPARKLRGGERVKVAIPPPPDTRLVVQDIPVPILYEDEHVILVDKPAGLVVHPGKGHSDGTLVNALLDKLDPHCGHPERPGIVHRLDKGTSGVMCVARTQAAYDGLIAQFAEHTVDRRYRALCWGYAKSNSGSMDEPLGRHPKDRKRHAVVQGGKRAVTHWSVEERMRFKVAGGDGWCSWFECRLETGRTHQVRVHLSHLGHPLVGDPMYTRPTYKPRAHLPDGIREAVAGLDHQLLHAVMLGFSHPVTGERIERRSELPADYKAVVDAVRTG